MRTRPALDFRRIASLPPYVFAVTDQLKLELRRAGDAVTVQDTGGRVFATGLAAADAAAIGRAAGRRSDESGLAEAVHRDYLVLHGDRGLP